MNRGNEKGVSIFGVFDTHNSTQYILYDILGAIIMEDGGDMITLLVIGILVFVVKVICFAVKATWGIAKALLYVIGIPVIVIGLFLVGLASAAVPLLIIALAIAFIWPAVKGN